MLEYLRVLEINPASDGRQYEKIDLEDLGDIGFADGYADLMNDQENIQEELHKRNLKDEQLEYYLFLYKEGYDKGEFMSQNADILYDEHGNLKDEYTL